MGAQGGIPVGATGGQHVGRLVGERGQPPAARCHPVGPSPTVGHWHAAYSSSGRTPGTRCWHWGRGGRLVGWLYVTRRRPPTARGRRHGDLHEVQAGGASRGAGAVRCLRGYMAPHVCGQGGVRWPMALPCMLGCHALGGTGGPHVGPGPHRVLGQRGDSLRRTCLGAGDPGGPVHPHGHLGEVVGARRGGGS